MPLLQDYNKLFEHTDNIRKIYVNGSVVWPSTLTPPDPKLEPFYVENISNNVETLSIVKNYNSAPTLTIEYSTDKTTWNTLGTTSTTALTYTLQPNDKLYLRCNTSRWSTISSNIINGVSKVGGNIMSLLYGNSFTGNETSFPDTTLGTIFGSLFTNGNIIDSSYLLLPATTLTDSCYEYMFLACTSLTTAPALPATALSNYCYQSMFQACASLTSAPTLPATTLAVSCYSNMFRNCTSLATAPALPATTLADYCYSNMFRGCTSLITAPALPATTFVNSCYNSMFSGCTSISNVKCLATSGINNNRSTTGWVNGVSATGTFTKATGVNWPTGISGIPSGWTVVEV